MSRIPKLKASKYNKNSKFSWVDSQWEKFIEEQKELKAENYDAVVLPGGFEAPDRVRLIPEVWTFYEKWISKRNSGFHPCVEGGRKQIHEHFERLKEEDEC